MPTKRQLGQRLSLRLLEEHFLRHDVETNVMFDNTLFSSLDPKGHAMYDHHLASVIVRKLLHFNLLL